jgi:iron uptake system component EfeO
MMSLCRSAALFIAFAFVFVFANMGCGSSNKTDAQFQSEIVAAMHQLLLVDAQGLNKAALDLQSAAPAAGWGNPANASDRAALAPMMEAWQRTRYYWERAESTFAESFPSIDDSIDSRYEDLLKANGNQDANLLDGTGVTGMHAIERILYAPGPADVAGYEGSLSGYQPAVWPADAEQAAAFKNGLCQKLVDDTKSLLDQTQTQPIDLPMVFTGLTGLMSAQAEKVGLAVSHREESRYSQKTLVDLRFNLAGTKEIFALFVPWLATKTYGSSLTMTATSALDGLDLTYSSVIGDSIPAPPSTWNSLSPTPDDQQSSFGKLYNAVVQDVDPNRSDSAVDAMNHVAQALDLPLFVAPVTQP